MAEESERFIPQSLGRNEQFVNDVRQLFVQPIKLLRAIANRTSVQPYKLLSEDELYELNRGYEVPPETLQRTAAALLYLKQGVMETGRNPVDAVYESRTLLGQEDLAKGREHEIAEVLSYTRKEREEYLAVQIFLGGPTFLNMRLLPTLLPTTQSGTELVGGYFWSISYLNAEGEQRSVTIGLTPGELEGLESTISGAKEQLETIKRSAGFEQKVEE